MEYKITNLGNGWYDFKQIPQEHRYIKIHALNCGTDRKAKNRAREIASDPNGVILIEIK